MSEEDTTVPDERSLYKAIAQGDIEIVKTFIENNCDDINSLEQNGDPPLYIAVHKKQLEITRLLLAAGADVNRCAHFEDEDDDFRFTQFPLHSCFRCEDCSPETAVELVTLLLDAGALLTVCDEDGNTPLHSAMSWSYWHPGAAQLLIDRGADMHTLNKKGQTPLHSCFHYQVPKEERQKRIAFMKDNDALLDIPLVSSVLVNAIGFGDKAAFLYLMELGCDVNHSDLRGITPVLQASVYGSLEFMKFLVALGGDVFHKCSNGQNSLHLACAGRANPDVVCFLKEKGLNLYDMDEDGNTAMDVACMLGWAESVIALLAADYDITNEGITVNSEKRQYTETVLLLPALRKFMSSERIFRLLRLLVAVGAKLPSGTFIHAVQLLPKCTPEMKDMARWVFRQAHNPRSLKDICRIHLRQHLKTPIVATLENLCIPNELKAFLKFEDFLKTGIVKICSDCREYNDECECSAYYYYLDELEGLHLDEDEDAQ